ncbi:MAG: immunoglobulin domain-containing protein [Verrucomicrobia bacterium]|nr:immunoglobulin domain-containing protein [Verrucomicrobiota bacterium]
MKNLTSVQALAIFLLLRLAGLPQAIGQPTITKQPTSIAVALEGSATLQVTASATTPLTFQWQFNSADLAGAISSRLTLTNVTLADLGSYTVAVRDDTGETTTQPAWLKLARWTQLVAFGDSECMAQYSNGPSWVDDLGGLLSLPTSSIKNYAVGGAGTLQVRSQINQYLSANKPDTNVLLAPWWAGVSSDLCAGHLPVAQVVSNYAMNLSLLAQAGGRFFILPTVAPLYLVPRFSGDAYVRSIDYLDLRARMDSEMQRLQAEFSLTLFRFDLQDLAVRLWANPTAYGFNNLTNAANACVDCDRTQYFWWDDAHLSAAAHRFIGGEMYRCLTPRLVIALPTGAASGVLDLQWQGGSPPFRLQRCVDLATGSWQSDELSFATNATTVSSAPQQYFRVLQLGQ